jgi:nucleoside-diphosphate kinase
VERTLLLVKPDGVQRGLIGEILSRLEKRGLRLIGLRMLWMDRPLVERLYSVHKGKPFYPGLLAYMTSGPIVAAILEGPRAIAVVRQAMGETDPAKAGPGTIRGDFGLDLGRNLVHGSDSPESAAREMPIFFEEKNLLAYPREIDRWIIE